MSQNEESKGNTGLTVLAEVADALTASAGEVRTRLVKTLTEREVSRRVDLLDKALVKRDQLQKEVYAVKAPGKKTYQVVDGKEVEVPSVYTQEELGKLKEETKQYNKKLAEATKKLADFDKLMEEAFTAPTTKLFDRLAKECSGPEEQSE